MSDSRIPSTSHISSRLLGAPVCILLLACGGSSPAPTPATPAPSIASFTASSGRINEGAAIQLTAAFSHGQGVVTPGGLSITSGVPLSVTPTTTTTYTLTVTGSGSPATLQATVTVDPLLVFTLPGSVRLELAAIPAGSFRMGSPDTDADRYSREEPQHPVTLSDAFHMGRYEVTQGQWLAVMGSNPSHESGDLARPVEMVSWEDVCGANTGFLARLNALTADSRPHGYSFRLPTEAEWEYAARAGTTQRFPWGDDPNYTLLPGWAWIRLNTTRTHPVGQKSPNPWGLFDMAGNVYEWCQDWYGGYASVSQRDPVGPTVGTERIIRGGSKNMVPKSSRPADRYYMPPAQQNDDLGFRIVLARQR